MPNDICQILLISSQSQSVQMLQKLLPEAEQSSVSRNLTFSLVVSDRYPPDDGAASDRTFDFILLDLSGVDDFRLDVLRDIRDRFLTTPLIVMTDRDDGTLLISAFQSGADGYLQLDTLDSTLLAYEIRLALERQQYRSRLERETQQQVQRQQQEREFQALDLLAESSTSITARMFGAESLRECLPDIFEDLTRSYGQLLDLALEQRAYKVDHNLSDRLRTLADKLGFLKAGPKDVIELHTTTLRHKNQDIPIAKAQAHVAEGRLLVLELMGYLTSFYRKYYIGLSTVNILPKSDKF